MTRVPVLDSEKTQTMTPRDFLMSIGVREEKIHLENSHVDEVLVSPTEITFSMYGKDATVTFDLTTDPTGEIKDLNRIETSNTPFSMQLHSICFLKTIVNSIAKERLVMLSNQFRNTSDFHRIHISKLFQEIIETY